MELISLGLSVPEKRSNPLDNPSVSLNDFAAWEWVSGGRSTDAGEVINERTALNIATVYTCIKVLSQSVASLPAHLLRITPQGNIRELDNPLAYLLGVRPNPEMTAFIYFETIVRHLYLTGNCYSEVERSAGGDPVALWPLNPRLTRPIRLPNGDLAFETTDGELGSNKRVLKAKDVLHVPINAHDGIAGRSPIELASRSLGLAAASAKFGSRFFSNYAMPQISLVTQQTVKPEDKIKMRQTWEELHSGPNQHRVAILDNGLDVKVLSITPDEAQFIQTRVHERSEICALFGVPPHMAGSEQKLSNSNVEQLNLSFILDVLRPILSSIEAEYNSKLIHGGPGQRSEYTLSFDISERQRGDTAAQVSLIAAGRQWGALTANDVLRMLTLPVAGPENDTRMVPVNMQNAQRLLDPPKVQQEQIEGLVDNAA
jgi:HK97 family phage portal protein